MANWPGRRFLSLPWPIKREHESLRAPFPRLCTLHLPLVFARAAARETRRRAIAGHPALHITCEQPLSILASSLASHSAAQEPDAQEHAAEDATSSLAGTHDPDRSSSTHDVYTASPPSSNSW
jgi:hypothetical protein